MKLSVVAVGKVRSKHLRALIDDYAKRLTRYGSLRTIEVKEAAGAATVADTRRRESDALHRAAPGSAFRVVLDERGDLLTSVELAAKMDKAAVHGRGEWAFLIGGAEGHDDSLRESADLVWSISPLTLPHELCRLVLVEQLYRAQTIRAGEKYHRA